MEVAVKATAMLQVLASIHIHKINLATVKVMEAVIQAVAHSVHRMNLILRSFLVTHLLKVNCTPFAIHQSETKKRLTFKLQAS